MTKLQKRVKHFMVSVGQNAPDSPIVPDNLTRVLRVSLLLEEALEFAEASGIEVSLGSDGAPIEIEDLNYNIVSEVDIVGIADACADVGVINAGNGIAYGLDLEPFEDEVCDSNDSKIDNGKRREDGKWIKGPNYRPANLEPILKEQSKNKFKGEF